MVNESISLGEQLVREYPASAEFRRELANALFVKSHVLLGLQANSAVRGGSHAFSHPRSGTAQGNLGRI